MSSVDGRASMVFGSFWLVGWLVGEEVGGVFFFCILWVMFICMGCCPKPMPLFAYFAFTKGRTGMTN